MDLKPVWAQQTYPHLALGVTHTDGNQVARSLSDDYKQVCKIRTWLPRQRRVPRRGQTGLFGTQNKKRRMQ